MTSLPVSQPLSSLIVTVRNVNNKLKIKAMAETDTASLSVSETLIQEQQPDRSPTLRLKLRKPKNDKKVQWTTDTVDNEHMNKKKSKCCCIYQKPKMFGESSSEDEDDECGSCRGHKNKCYRSQGDGSDAGPSNEGKTHDHGH